MNDSAFSILEEHGAAFCIYDLARYQSPMKVAADFVYVRLHGPSEKNTRGSMTTINWPGGQTAFKNGKIGVKTCTSILINDDQGFAPQNASELIDMIQ